MNNCLPRKPDSNEPATNRFGRRLQTWLMVCSALLLALILARLFKLQIIFEIEFDGELVSAALTSLETYYLPLTLVFLYFVLNWAWKRFFDSGRS